ncbi:hypothetical protein, partial [Acinetobacter baumannii]|uniref:hypothetical protein n=1 Tax=Acinetobacter baumannii TaxID=470 RepID=UPI001C08901B
MKKTMRSSLRGILLACLLALSAMAAPAQVRADEVVVGQGITIGWAPFFVAEGRDLWKQNGLDAKVVSIPSGRL